MPGHAYYLGMALAAAQASKDRSRKVGAVIIGQEGEVRSTGYNGFPRGVDDDIEARHERPAKYHWTEHAERNAIYQAARVGTPLRGSILVCVAEGDGIGVCSDCARGIIQAGIKMVIFAKTERKVLDIEQRAWPMEDLSIALAMFAEAGVEYLDATE